MHKLIPAGPRRQDALRTHPTLPRRTARVALLDDCDVVTLGLRHLLAPHRDLELVPADRAVDVVLFDPTLLEPDARAARLRQLLGRPGTRVVAFTWDAHRAVAEEALAAGASGCLSKTLSGAALASSLRRILRGEVVVEWGDAGPEDRTAEVAEQAGLSRREVEVLGLIGRGMTNEDIARLLFLSPNSIKSYIRGAYRKIGVERRSQAVLWVHQHGLQPAAPVAPGLTA